MKILYVAHSAGPQGAGFALINIVKGIQKKGITPIVVLPSQGRIADEMLKLNVKTFHIRCYNAIYPPYNSFRDIIFLLPRFIRTILFNYLASIRLSKIVKEEKPDIIHTNSGVIRYSGNVAYKYNIPHIWHIREYQTLDFNWTPIGGLKRQIELFQNHNSHCVAITKDIFRYFKLQDNKDVVIYDGVFPKDIQLPLPSKQNYLLFIGYLKKEKGILDVISAFEKACESIPDNIELWIAGEDGIKINEIILNSPRKSRIRYLGFRNDIYNLLANALALIVPSQCEGFGFITVEAMLNKCLVIGRNTGGTKEQFDNGVHETNSEIGLRFSNIVELSDCIQQVTNGTIDTLNIINNAYRVVTSKYSIENNIDKLYKLYLSVFNNAHK